MDNRPVAWLHTMHFTDVGGTDERVTFSDENAYGVPGRDYSETFEVTTEPLYKKPAVKVKPLEWLDDADGGLAAQSAVGDYELHKAGCFDVEVWELINTVQLIGRWGLDKLDEAKAAAQADYEARILSAIEIT